MPASPCVRCCCLDDRTDTCVGCFRTLAEIMRWGNANAEERRQILLRCAQRRAERPSVEGGSRG
ncbi:MAG: DUF1289 domain-containing protein [Uliginosibacterium sp.]|nr:DUF1289 domain-containing protein [Uliginosibacterium sp.]MBK9393506.1 DUF1289 domain-containing protein [Uliginosibacterium sp.]